MSRWRAVRSLLIPAAIALVLLLLLEVALRLSSFPVPRLEEARRGMRPEPWGYSFAPGAYFRWERGNHSTTLRADEDGLLFRGAAPRGAPKVLFIGDSFTAGSEEGSYVRELHALAAARGAPLEVVNGGVIGYNGREVVNWYHERGAPHGADLVVYGFYFNDVTGYHVPSTWRLSSREPRLLISDPSVRDLTFWRGFTIPEPTTATSLIRSNLRLAQAVERLLSPPSPYGMAVPDAWARELRPSYGKQERADLSDLLRRLAGIVQAQRERGGRFAILMIPDGAEVVGPPGPGRYFDVLQGFCREHGVACVDTLPALRAAQAAGTKTYWNAVDDGDAHCTPEGYRVIADTLLDAYTRSDGFARPEALAGDGTATAAPAPQAAASEWAAVPSPFGQPRVSTRDGRIAVVVSGAPSGISLRLPVEGGTSATVALDVALDGPLTVRFRDGEALVYFNGVDGRTEYALSPQEDSPELLLYSDADTRFTLRGIDVIAGDGPGRSVRRARLRGP